MLSHRKDEMMPRAATWMNLEIIIFSKVRHRKTNIMWYHLCNLKKKWSYLQTEIDLQKINMIIKAGDEGRDKLWVWDKLWINRKDLLYKQGAILNVL